MKDKRRIAIVGGGAAGCFAAALLSGSAQADALSLTVYEAGKRLLAKVAITGGGRCNLTNTFSHIDQLREAYPRGSQLMKRALRAFSAEDACRWFESEGVRLTVLEDQYVFPVSQDAMQIVRTLENRLRRGGVAVRTEKRLQRILPEAGGGYRLRFADGTEAAADAVLLALGGKKKPDFLEGLDIRWETAVPSLFSFRLNDPALTALQGTVVENVSGWIPGTSFRASGELLITDWGLSGPVILKLSSYAARYLAETDYHAPLSIRWLEHSYPMAEASKRLLSNAHPEEIPTRLWRYLLQRWSLPATLTLEDVRGKMFNRLRERLLADEYRIDGRGQFKSEFVTAGGVSLDQLHLSSLEAKAHPALYFAGELLDVDGITGGFNLQAAWSTAYVVARAIAASQ